MHSNGFFLKDVAGFLGGYYAFIAVMNGVAALILWRRKDQPGWAIVWSVVAAVSLILASLALSGSAALVPSLPLSARLLVNKMSGPVLYTLGTTALFTVLFVFRKFFVKPMVAWTVLNALLVLMGLSMADENFASIVMKPDNVPIVGLVFLLAFFTWVATSQAVVNDERIKQGLPPMEKLNDEKVLVWPDLVYTELICMVGVTAFLLVWAIFLQAPLEEPASSVKTPNPSKAPWYFLGLQEMLVYFDPWYAGVVLPSMVVFGLMAMPYLDFNKKGNGYYSIEERKFSYLVYQFGFFELWITLIILGTFLRGPNWNFFGPFEYWTPYKVEVLNNVDLPQMFWVNLLDRPLPRAPQGAGALTQVGTILLREAPGLVLLGAYLVLLPPLLAVTVFRKFFAKMGFVRYMIMANLMLLMLTLPLKMVLRWTLNLKYIVSIPEFSLNF
jgi:Cytochrome b(C-terminal)/b6/petD